MNNTLAHDRMGSVRMTDEDGRLHVAATSISKAAVNAYYGREIPGADALGLDPNRHYNLLRDPKELARAAPSFNALPVLAEHAHVTADAPRADLVVGTTGTNVRFASPYLTNSLAIWNAGAIHNIRSGAQRELSCAYRYTPVMEAGQFEGQPYDGRMTNIRGNHVALVPSGRAGPDVVVADAKPKDIAMDPTHSAPTAGQVFARLGTAFASGALAMTASVAELGAWLRHNGMADAPTAHEHGGASAAPASASGPHPAPASTPAPGTPPTDRSGGTLATVGDTPAATPATAQTTTGQDSAVQSAVTAALAAERTRAAHAQEARTLVRPLVGDVLGMDSAADILRYALTEQGVHTDGVNEPGLKALVLACLGTASPAAGGSTGAPVGAADHAAPLATRFGVHAPRKL
ncbi:DUF2213 domain-containing protein [Acetobacter lambici]|uniref:DUF2213 domain-containing protein n=1 Tax=Acetobacter lambici TaxID=1332824 RepID=A0ABT1EY60_9PROT|nr:DUF2213 domain-containing protein [Acetobacter lambici]MCP1241761.1 DUF2213 domain-containing protein [Acetobacter lambici]MCP1257886.1 DUF2213 domain-containing protein [Acetobacter lambici]